MAVNIKTIVCGGVAA